MSRIRTFATRALSRSVRPFGLAVVERGDGIPRDVEPEVGPIARAVAPFTMTSPARIAALCESVRYVVRHDIPGAIVECGVWRGGSVMAAIRMLQALDAPPRDVYLFDTFEGMPPPGDRDLRYDAVPAATLLEQPVFRAEASLDEVKANVESTGYPRQHIHYVPGRVEDTLPAQAPDRVALLRLDTDWYESTKHELETLVPRLSPHGVVIIDDYGYFVGARQAVDEFLAGLDRPVLLNRIDHTGRLAVVPPS